MTKRSFQRWNAICILSTKSNAALTFVGIFQLSPGYTFKKEVCTIFEPPYYKVWVGVFTDWQDATEMQKRAKQEGFKDAWVVVANVKSDKTASSQPRKQGSRSTGTDSRQLHGGKFGFFDIEEPAVGVALGLRKISPHLQLILDSDLVKIKETTPIFSFEQKSELGACWKILHPPEPHTRSNFSAIRKCVFFFKKIPVAEKCNPPVDIRALLNLQCSSRCRLKTTTPRLQSKN